MFYAIYVKALFAGFLNGLYIGRKLKYGYRKKHFYRLQHNSEERSEETERRIRDSSDAEEFNFCMVKDESPYSDENLLFKHKI